MTMKEKITNKLSSALGPDILEVTDESHLHAGHVGSRPRGETHFHVRISKDVFPGLSRVQQHRKIYGILAEELKSKIHALRIDVI